MFILDPGSEYIHPGSRIRGKKDSGSRLQIRIKEFTYGVKKIPDPGSGSALKNLSIFLAQLGSATLVVEKELQLFALAEKETETYCIPVPFPNLVPDPDLI